MELVKGAEAALEAFLEAGPGVLETLRRVIEADAILKAHDDKLGERAATLGHLEGRIKAAADGAADLEKSLLERKKFNREQMALSDAEVKDHKAKCVLEMDAASTEARVAIDQDVAARRTAQAELESTLKAVDEAKSQAKSLAGRLNGG